MIPYPYPQFQKEARDTITLLAGVETTSTIVSDAIFKAVKRGQVVPIAVVLLLARDTVLGDVSAFGNQDLSGPLIFTQSIMNTPRFCSYVWRKRS